MRLLRRSFFVNLVLGITFLVAGAPLRGQGFAYVANAGTNNVSGFKIGPVGALTPVPNSPFPAGSGPEAITVASNGLFVYVVGRVSSKVSGFLIGADGALTAMPDSPFPIGVGAGASIAVAVDPSVQFAYVANVATNNITAFSLDVIGRLTRIGNFPTGRGATLPVSLAIDPSGQFLYVANLGPSIGSVSLFTISPNGSLGFVDNFTAGGAPGSVAVDPSGQLLYVANRASNNVSAFKINALTGRLTTVPGPPFAAGIAPVNVTVDPTGQFVYVSNPGSLAVPGSLSAYSIIDLDPKSPTFGALTQLAGSPYPAGGSSPFGLAVDPTGQFLYVSNLRSDNLTQYTLTRLGTAVRGVNIPAGGSFPASIATTAGPQ